MSTQQKTVKIEDEDLTFRMRCTEVAIGLILKHLAKHQGIDIESIIYDARDEAWELKTNGDLACRTVEVIDSIEEHVRAR